MASWSEVNEAARELLCLENKDHDDEALECLLARLPSSLRQLIKPQRVALSGKKDDFFLVYLHDCRNEAYAQRLLSFFATTLRSLDEPSYIANSCADLLSVVTRIVLKDMSDWCRIDLRDDLEYGPGVVAHSTKSLEPFLTELRKLESGNPDEVFAASRVMRSGVAVFNDDVSADLLRVLSTNPQIYALFQKVGLNSYICVPIKKETTRSAA